jgi:DNA-3-methyladenine glycosylase
MKARTLPLEFYLDDDVIEIGKNLLGKVLHTKFNGQHTSGIIIETEAYRGPEDKGSHAYNNRRTPRNEVMYHQGGIAYIYKCYGIHNMINAVTNNQDVPHAILIRALKPLDGIAIMLKRRKKELVDKTLTSGPGSLTQALGITTKYNGISLMSKQLWIEDQGFAIPDKEIISGPRIGIEYAKEDALLPWRFTLTKKMIQQLV